MLVDPAGCAIAFCGFHGKMAAGVHGAPKNAISALLLIWKSQFNLRKVLKFALLPRGSPAN
jgi:hypothetical protein